MKKLDMNNLMFANTMDLFKNRHIPEVKAELDRRVKSYYRTKKFKDAYKKHMAELDKIRLEKNNDN